MFGRAPKPALTPAGALPNGFKKNSSQQRALSRQGYFYREKSGQKKGFYRLPSILHLVFLSRQKELFCQTVVKKTLAPLEKVVSKRSQSYF